MTVGELFKELSQRIRSVAPTSVDMEQLFYQERAQITVHKELRVTGEYLCGMGRRP